MYKFELMAVIVLTFLEVVLELLNCVSNISNTKGQNNIEHKDFT